MAIAYINEENVVLHIVLSDEERIKPSDDGNMYMTPGKYNHNLMKYDHIFGVGQKVTEVAADGLSIGSVYEEYVEPVITEEEQVNMEISNKESYVNSLLGEFALEYIKESKEFEDWLAKKFAEADSAEILEETNDEEVTEPEIEVLEPETTEETLEETEVIDGEENE